MSTPKQTRQAAAQQPTGALKGTTLAQAVSWALDQAIFGHLKVHGNTTWQAWDLILLTITWVWSDDATLTGAFAEARRWSLDVLGRVAVTSYQGLLKALVRWTPIWLPLVWQQLHQVMEEHGGAHQRIGRWLALAVDGSRVSVPRTQDNEKAFTAPHYGKGKTARYRNKNGKKNKRPKTKKPQPVQPQIWLTLLWHLGLRMPWSWKTGPSYSAEREHFRQLLAEQVFPQKTLFCADAGFVGYDLWRTIHQAGHALVIRVGANVKLLRRLGYVREKTGIVYCWPNKQARRGQPPLVLRLFRLRVGRCVMHLVSNVLDEEALSEALVCRLYQLRWGVELQFRTLKQTFKRRQLRSRTPARAYVELDWSLVGLWLIQLFVVKEQLAIGQLPQQASVALAIAVVRDTMQRWWERPEEAFVTKLQAARQDDYQRHRSKKARYQPRYKDKPKAGKPVLHNATSWHKARLRQWLRTVG